VRPAITRHIDYLRQQLKPIERDIDGAVRGAELWRHQAELMDSVAGLGPTLRACLVAWLPEWGRLNRAAAAQLVGIAPLPDESGKIRGLRRVTGGGGHLRQVRYMATMGAMLHNPQLRAYYLRLRAKGQLHKVALVATLRKRLLILNALIKTARPWRASCQSNACSRTLRVVHKSTGGRLKAFPEPVDLVGNPTCLSHMT
jgi:transposase